MQRGSSAYIELTANHEAFSAGILLRSLLRALWSVSMHRSGMLTLGETTPKDDMQGLVKAILATLDPSTLPLVTSGQQFALQLRVSHKETDL